MQPVKGHASAYRLRAHAFRPARRELLARDVGSALAHTLVEKRVDNADPFRMVDNDWENAVGARLLDDRLLALDDAMRLLGE